MAEKAYRKAWKLYSPDGEFTDTIFEDWYHLCAYLMCTGENGKHTDFAIKACLIYD